ncbi:hypothetical protein ASE01_06595 [Nocardioides sp. Root190]|uniref:aggregation-promoting factor C-terminal-like domain-containing protein n=1 Tax=Nocardioides sp. Root190 TaxID=1736488 RepID=UPI0006F6DD39|nr:hypothetical protein [Nocardioides sp. Root190]KRB78227.1 hypothetical protein ASE01_06595 [Nocardioides sp. Root190]
MSKHAKPAPKHRGAPKHAHIAEAPRRAARNVVVLSSVAVAVTGVSVAAGILGNDTTPPAASVDAETLAAAGQLDPQVTAERDAVVSRADRRPEADPAKTAGLDETASAAMTDQRKLSDSDPKDIAKALFSEFGFSASQFGCLDSLWTRESNWRWNADNPTSSAYGIPQALPGSKMSSAGADWATNPATQIRWGLGYIQARYGSPCAAWGHSESHNWY